MLTVMGGNSASTGYNLTRSLRFRSSASAYLNRTSVSSPTNGMKWTWSGWVKRGSLGGASVVLMGGYLDDNNFGSIAFASDTLTMGRIISGTYQNIRQTNAVFRDPSAWYHIVFVFDNANATVSDRAKIFVNGVLQTYSTSTDPSTSGMFINAASYVQTMCRTNYNGGSQYFDGYMTEVNFIDGQALTPSSFGSTNALTGVWQPARYTGTYGTNGFYLPFTDNSALTTSSNVGLGKDFSGNGNYWTTNNISITSGVTYDSMTDVPTLTSATAANFAVLNPLKSYYAPTNGNLSMSTGANSTGIDVASISLGTGVKYYFEATATGGNQQIGIFSSNHALTPTGSKRYWYLESGGLYNDGTLLQSVSTFTSGDTIAVAWDGTAQTVTFYKNNTQQGTAISVDTSYSYFFGVGVYNGGWNVNFGQRPFTYTPPTGFVALNTYNLPTSTIVKGNTVMDATLWTGNGSTQTITNAAGFKPDFVWIKNRNNVRWHILTDSVRGTNSQLFSNDTAAQETRTDRLTAFNSNGFSVGSYIDVNGNADTFVGWQWQAGQGSSSSNTNGTITSTVSVNASAGFSVVTYTGTGANATVGHGLGVAPSLIICKSRGASTNWGVWHTSLTAYSYFLLLNSTAAQATAANSLQALPTSTLVSLGASSIFNDASTMVMYAWTPIAGYSAFGSYTGNSSTDGPFVYTGFRPKYLLIRRTDAAASWLVFDSARDTYNAATKFLRTNLADAETTSADVALDFLSNGFKLRQTSTNINAGTIIYMAFAENPFRNALAR